MFIIKLAGINKGAVFAGFLFDFQLKIGYVIVAAFNSFPCNMIFQVLFHPVEISGFFIKFGEIRNFKGYKSAVVKIEKLNNSVRDSGVRLFIFVPMHGRSVAVYGIIIMCGVFDKPEQIRIFLRKSDNIFRGFEGLVFPDFKTVFRVNIGRGKRFIKENRSSEGISALRKIESKVPFKTVHRNISAEKGAFAGFEHEHAAASESSGKLFFSVNFRLNDGCGIDPDCFFAVVGDDRFHFDSVFLAIGNFRSLRRNNGYISGVFIFACARIGKENNSESHSCGNADYNNEKSCFFEVHYTFHPFFNSAFAEGKNSAIKGIRSVSGKGNKAFGIFGADIVFCAGKNRFVAGNFHIPDKGIVADPDQRIEPVNVESKGCQKPPEVISTADMGAFMGNYRSNFCLVIKVKIHRKDNLRFYKSADNGSSEKLRKADFIGIFDAFEFKLSEHRKISDYSEKEQRSRSENPDRSENLVFIHGNGCDIRSGYDFAGYGGMIGHIDVRVIPSGIYKNRELHPLPFVFYENNRGSDVFLNDLRFRNDVENAEVAFKRKGHHKPEENKCPCDIENLSRNGFFENKAQSKQSRHQRNRGNRKIQNF